MQIHEVTQKPLKEAGVLGAIGSTLTNIVKDKIGASAGQYNSRVGGQTAQNQQGVQKTVNAAVAGPMAQSLTKAVAEIINGVLTNSKTPTGNPATSIAEIDSASKGQLLKQLEGMINGIVSPGSTNTDYHTIDDKITDPVQKTQASDALNTIDNSLEQILKQMTAGTKVDPTLYTKLATGVLNVQNIMQYATPDTASSGASAPSGLTSISPELNALGGKIKMTPEELKKLTDLKTTGITSTELGKILGLKP